VFALAMRLKLPQKADIKWFLLAGLIGFFLYVVAFNKGSEGVSSATGSVTLAIVPMLTSLLARLVYKEKLSVIKWVASAIEFSGVAVLALLEGSFSFKSGLLWLLVAALSLSVYNLIQRKLTKSYSGLQTSAYGIFAGTLMLAVFLPGAAEQAKQAPPISFLYIAILGVFSSALAYVSWAEAFKRSENSATVSNYMFLTPFFASFAGFLLIGERINRPTLIGGGIILFGLFMFNYGERLLDKYIKQKKIVG
jgi:RarD protein